ncbi:MAG: hypothetical protein PHT88_03490 [Candidatus Moranbacteria bacterium]|nr:hypothetical protein [Candidatus Moranbacteria bacterium]
MNDEIKDITTGESCTCEGDTCPHQEETQETGFMTKYRGSEEIALAFLLALTPLVVLTFFGQVGLI